jgi:phage minor structural protein
MITLHNSRTKNFNNNGLGILKDCISAKVCEVLNGEFNINITYPVGGYLYPNLVEDNIIVTDVGYGKRQAFRIKNVNKRLDNIEVYATHIFYDLNDNLIEDIYPKGQTGETVINYILSHAQYEHNFIGYSNITKTSTARYIRKNLVESLIGEDSNSFINRWGGEIIRDNYNITMVNKRGVANGMQIRYAKNLTGIEFQIDRTTVGTRIMPKAFDGILLPEKYIDSPNIDIYPHPIIKIIEYSDLKLATESGEGFASKTELYQAMRERVQEEFKNEIDKPTITTTVNFVELANTKEYQEYKELEKLNIGDYSTVYVPHLNINVTQRVYKTIYDAILGKFVEFEMGYVKSNYITQIIKSEANMNEVVLPSIVEQAAKESTEQVNYQIEEQVNAALAGYVYKTKEALYVMDSSSLNGARKIYRWSKLGLTYSDKGMNGPYETVMSQEGEINADFIKSGTIDPKLIGAGINASLITEGIINADLITDGEINADLITKGEINADLITKGSINASLITTGLIRADLIARGILKDTRSTFSIDLETGRITFDQIYLNRITAVNGEIEITGDLKVIGNIYANGKKINEGETTNGGTNNEN